MQTTAETESDGMSAWFADELLAVATCADPDHGVPAMVERSASAGQMGPLHRRGQAETYRVLEGEVTFYVDGESVTVPAGGVAVAPAGATRTFRAGPNGARWFVLTHVRSLDQFTHFARAVCAVAAELRWPSAEEWVALEAMAAANDIELLGPPGALP
jgi:quercetin dioxygenase-like cupin family protein